MIKSVTKNAIRLLLHKYHLLVFLMLFTTFSHAATITTITVKEKDSVSTANYPLTFGMVFKAGDVAGNVYLNNFPTQTDIKSTWPDGSIRHAVISALIPIVANQDIVININDTGTAANPAPMLKSDFLATDVGAKINLSNLSGGGYSGNLTADLRSAINAESLLDYWLEGGVVSEILVHQKLNNSLNAAWEVRFYPGTPYIRISHSVENVEANFRGDIDYAVNISQGNSSSSVVYTKSTFQHNAMARWRKVFWLKSEPPEVEIHYDLEYLISTGHIPSYDTSLTVDESAISSQYSAWVSSDTDIMGNGLQHNNFASGVEGSLLQDYAVIYLFTWDNRMRNILLGMGEVTGSCPVHYREFDTSKSFYGHIISIDDRPDVRTHESRLEGLPSPIDTVSSQWGVDQAHQWSYNYLPYLITGEKWYLDELYYWAGWNLSFANPNCEYGRCGNDGLLPWGYQVRGVAWAYRTMVQAAAIAPNGDIEKAYFEEKIANNISQWAAYIKTYPLRHLSVRNDGPSGMVASVTAAISPWMQDFLAVSLVHGGDLGFDASSVLVEFSKFIVGRFANPDFNWFNGPVYRFPVWTDAVVSTWKQASDLYASQPTFLPDPDYAISYRMKALAACSQLTIYENGQVAYNWLKANVNDQDTLNDNPTWALIPREKMGVQIVNAPQNLEVVD